ncbi:MAG: hypothetical protein KBT31_05685, partial [Firmicutes bacterium]|nr:hypothetical protein [Candidatus Colimorpha enterica]
YYGTASATVGAYKNVLDLDGDVNYIDISKPCWYGDYLSKITMHNDTLYFLAGDISPTILGWASCSFVNHSLYSDVFGDTDEFLKSVLDGKWTIDVLMEKSKAVYIDVNQNNRVDLDDRLGSATSRGQAAQFALIAAGFQFVRTLNDGSLELAMDTERNADIFGKLCELYQHTEGFTTYDYSSTPNGNSETFAEGRMLFMNEYILYAFREQLREMTDPYVIIPRPKADEQEDKYHSSLQDSLFLYTIPKSVDPSKDEMVSAFIQTACLLYNEKVVPAMFDTALKVKFVADEVDVEMAGKLIDLVRTGITTDFSLVYDSSTGFAAQVSSIIQSGLGKWSTVLAQTDRHKTTLANLLDKFEQLRQREKNQK